MKATKFLLALAILAAAGSANATTWNIEMSGSGIRPPVGPVDFIGFVGIWDDVSNTGTWTGTTTLSNFETTLHYTQTFTMNEFTGVGTLNAWNLATCTATRIGSWCEGLDDYLSSLFGNDFLNTAVNPADPNGYKQQLAFIPVDGWTGQWTLQVYWPFDDPLQYFPLPMNVTLHSQAPAVPVPAAAWLFGSGLLGLAGVARRRAA